MMLLITLFVLILLGVVLIKSDNDNLEILGYVCAILCSIVLFTALAAIPLNRNDFYCDKARLEAFKQTVTLSRKSNLSDIERAAVLQKIAEWNEIIAATKYDN